MLYTLIAVASLRQSSSKVAKNIEISPLVSKVIAGHCERFFFVLPRDVNIGQKNNCKILCTVGGLRSAHAVKSMSKRTKLFFSTEIFPKLGPFFKLTLKKGNFSPAQYFFSDRNRGKRHVWLRAPEIRLEITTRKDESIIRKLHSRVRDRQRNNRKKGTRISTLESM